VDITPTKYADRTAAPRAAIFLPFAFLLHVMEEWFAGLPAWTVIAPGAEVSPERFLLINTVALLLFTIGTLAAFYYPRMAWFATTFAALLGLNALVHSLATLGLGLYSPGTVTGLLLFLPLSAIVLRASASRFSGPVFAGCILSGFLLHGLAYFLARL